MCCAERTETAAIIVLKKKKLPTKITTDRKRGKYKDDIIVITPSRGIGSRNYNILVFIV